jgi:phosphoribosylaminoimidazolecarboxamide formyltransferase / IMP cyclohydrolase
VDLLRGTTDKCCLMQNAALGSIDATSLDTATRFRYVRGGFLEQPNYTFVPELSTAVQAGPDVTANSVANLAFAWAIGSTSNSNTITLVRNGMLIGNGVGQQDRVGAAELAIKRARDAGHDTADAVAYSDSFFPFPDGPERLMDSGVRVIFATSGSVRDSEVRAACAARGATLLMLPDSEARGFFAH